MSEGCCIEYLIEACLAKKVGDKELGLFYLPGLLHPWTVGIGNPLGVVSLGESSGEYTAEGATLEEALQNLLTILP